MELKIYDQEIRLQKLWKRHATAVKTFKTVSGNVVEILFEGIENFDSGPDFKDAMIKVRGRALKGDVEVHLDPAGWYAHKHHQDPAYNHVILHVIAANRSEFEHVEREDGVSIEQIVVDLKQSIPEDEEKKTSPELIVQDCPLSKCRREKITAVLNVASQMRFEQKAAQIDEDLVRETWEQIIYRRIAESLGYAKNRIPFRTLTERIPYAKLLEEMQWVDEDVAQQKCAALLFGTAGFLPSQQKNTTGGSQDVYIEKLEMLWRQASHRNIIEPMQPHEWYFFRLRPFNFPTRRLAGLIQLIGKVYRTGFVDYFYKIVLDQKTGNRKKIRELEKALQIEANDFWNSHYTLDGPQPAIHHAKKSLIGKSRARDIIINVVLPVTYSYSLEVGDSRTGNIIREIYRMFPKLQENMVNKAMTAQLTAHNNDLLINPIPASQQQALIFLHKFYCNQLRCEECIQLSG